MNLRCTNLFFLIFIALVALIGCEKAERMMMDGTSPADTPSEVEAIPVKLVWFINFAEGGKAAYDSWVASNAETFRAEELVRSRTYDNVDPEKRPHRYVELEFESFLDAATYMNRPEIAALLQEGMNYVTAQTTHTFIQRPYDGKHEAGDWKIKYVTLADYPLGGRQAYFDWVASVVPAVHEPPQLKAVEIYENYYGASPHRLLTLEFESVADMDAYLSLDLRKTFEAELAKRVHSWVRHRFQLRADYINQ